MWKNYIDLILNSFKVPYIVFPEEENFGSNFFSGIFDIVSNIGIVDL